MRLGYSSKSVMPDIRSVYHEMTGLPVPGCSRASSGSVLVHCPCSDHNDAHPSCSLNFVKGVFYCHSCGRGGGVLDLPVAAGVAENRSGAAVVLRRAGLPVCSALRASPRTTYNSDNRPAI